MCLISLGMDFLDAWIWILTIVFWKLLLLTESPEFDYSVSYGTIQFCSLATEKQKADADILIKTKVEGSKNRNRRNMGND